MLQEAIKRSADNFKSTKASPAKTFAESTVAMFQAGGWPDVHAAQVEFVKMHNLVRWEQLAIKELIIGAHAVAGLIPVTQPYYQDA